MERKDLPLTQAAVTDRGEFEGMASTHHLDLQGDVVAPGAFSSSLPRFLERGFISWGHDATGAPIGYPLEAREVPQGLYLRAGFHGTAAGQTARQVTAERLAAGKAQALSIGYSVPEGGWRRRRDGVRELLKVELLEVSLVTAPANPYAFVTGAKAQSSADPERLALELERLKFQTFTFLRHNE